MRGLQRLLGVPRIGWVFVAPNLVILGLFTFLPIAIDFYYAFTGGAELLPRERPFTGLDNLATLFECTNHFDPSTCRKDLFWRALYNTAWFAVPAGRAHGVVQPDHGAGAEPEDPRARLLPRRVLLSGAAVAGRRRADLEMGAAARGRAQRASS